MPASTVAIVYSANLKQVRRTYVADSDAALNAAVTVGVGEKRIDLPYAEYVNPLNTPECWAGIVHARIGGQEHEGRVIEQQPDGLVVGVYLADIDIDVPILHPDNTLTYHETATVGDVVVDGVIVPPSGEGA